jgi:ATP-dependent DNA ligase
MRAVCRAALLLRAAYLYRSTMPSPRRRRTRPSDLTSDFPAWVAPQLTELVEKAPAGDEWAHEIKLDGYRMHARIDRGRVQLLTRTGLDWTAKYPNSAAALQALPIQQAYIDGELCAVSETGVTSFGLMQAATDGRRTAALVFYAFDLLYLNGENLTRQPLADRKRGLQRLPRARSVTAITRSAWGRSSFKNSEVVVERPARP